MHFISDSFHLTHFHAFHFISLTFALFISFHWSASIWFHLTHLRIFHFISVISTPLISFHSFSHLPFIWLIFTLLVSFDSSSLFLYHFTLVHFPHFISHISLLNSFQSSSFSASLLSHQRQLFPHLHFHVTCFTPGTAVSGNSLTILLGELDSLGVRIALPSQQASHSPFSCQRGHFDSTGEDPLKRWLQCTIYNIIQYNTIQYNLYQLYLPINFSLP